MKALKYLSFADKLADFAAALGILPFIDQTVGELIGATFLLKDTVNRLNDLLDNSKPNESPMS